MMSSCTSAPVWNTSTAHAKSSSASKSRSRTSSEANARNESNVSKARSRLPPSLDVTACLATMSAIGLQEEATESSA